MTEELVRGEQWYVERDKALRAICVILANTKTHRAKKLSIKELNMLEATQELGLDKETDDLPPENALSSSEPRSKSNWYSRVIANEKRKPIEIQNPGW